MSRDLHLWTWCSSSTGGGQPEAGRCACIPPALTQQTCVVRAECSMDILQWGPWSFCEHGLCGTITPLRAPVPSGDGGHQGL